MKTKTIIALLFGGEYAALIWLVLTHHLTMPEQLLAATVIPLSMFMLLKIHNY